MENQKDFAKFYLDHLSTTFSGLNLTRIVSHDEFYEKQIIDSLKPFELDVELVKIAEKLGYVVDVGFGGGFPVLPLRNFLDKNIKILGVDSRKKKVSAVNYISRSYGQKNICFVHSRVEDLNLNTAALITFKAVGEVNKMLRLLNCSEGSYVLFYKAKNFEELEPNYKKNKGYEFIKIKKFNVGSNERCCVLFRKLKTKEEDNSLVKLSDFVFN